MMKFLACTALVLLAVTLAFPVVEDSIVSEDEMLERVFSDSTPLTLMQDPKSIKHAKDKKEENKKAEAAAAAEEDKQTKLEAKETAEAKKLAGVEAGEKKKYEDDLHKEEKEAADEAQHAAEAGAKADAATAKAEEESKKFGADMKKIEDKMAKEEGAAKKADAKRVADDKAYIAKANADAAKETKAAKAKKDAAAHNKKLGVIGATYQKTMKALTAKKAKAEAAFSAEGAKITATFNKAVKGNKAAYKAKKKQLAEEKKANAKKAAADQAKIKADYAKKVAAHNKAEAAYQKAQDAAAAVLKAKRNKAIAAAKAKAKKADDAYAADKAVADKMQADADAADAKYKASVTRSAKEQKEADSAAAKHQAEDAAMAECPEGSCADAKQKCHKVDNKKTFFSCSGPTDGWGCADHPCKSDPFDIENEYLGKKAQPVYPKPPKPSAACKAAHGVFAKAFAAAGGKKQDNMYTGAACAPIKDAAGFAKVKTAMEDWLDMMAKCPKYCAPGTVMYTSDGVQDDDGVCLNADTLAQAKMELGKITKDTCMGTNCKIKADFPTQGKTLCARATAATAGFYAAVNEARKENIAHPPCGKCYGECTGAKGVADAKACKYEFYAKGMFAAKKCTCADDHVAGFHQEELMQSPKSIKHAKDKKEENKKAEAAAAAEEDKQTKLEAKETAEAKKLAGVEAGEKKKYEDDLHKEEKEAADEAQHAAEAGAKADAATAKAEEESKKFGADMKKIEDKMAKEEGAAKKADAKRVADDKAYIAKANAD